LDTDQKSNFVEMSK